MIKSRLGKTNRALEVLGTEYIDKVNNKMLTVNERVKQLETIVESSHTRVVNEAKKLSRRADDMTKSVELISKALAGDKQDILERYKSFTDMQKLVNMQVIKSSTLTEVVHFMYQVAPEYALQATMKIINLHYESDEFWNKHKDLVVWEWAAMLFPQFEDKWKKQYAKFTQRPTGADGCSFER
jgi:hypothetical protein